MWVVLAVVVVAIGAVGAWLTTVGQYAAREALDPDSFAPQGTHALAEVLRDHGVEVEVVRTVDDARAQLHAGTTLVVGDATYLDANTLDGLARGADTLVLLSPDAYAVDALFDGSMLAAAYGGDAVAPSCDLPVARAAGPVAAGALYTPAGAATGCYPTGAGYGLLALDVDGGLRYAIDASAVMTNDRLAEGANAALAVALLGEHERVLWFVPSIDDPALAVGGSSLGELTPGWVTPAVLVLVVAALVAMVWRGRRFGPLVAETLPVTVRAGETTAGRARLYARSKDPVHAADQLRIASATRLARILGLGPTATADAIAAAAAARLGADLRTVRAVLLDDLPAVDRDLVDLADRLRHLEAAVRAAAFTGRNGP